MLPFALALVSAAVQQPAPAALIGHWDCAGHFVRSGKPIAAALDIRLGANPTTLLISHRDKPPTSYRADEIWVFGDGARAAIADASGMRWFDMEVSPDTVVLARADEKGPLERFVYTLAGGGDLTIDWLHRGPGADLALGDTVRCRRVASG
jgi:hypothetical protein